MANILNNYGKKISNIGQRTVRKTKDIAAINKLNGMIKNEERNLESLYKEIGEKGYKNIDCSNNDEIRKLVAAIELSKSQLKILDEELNKLKGLKKCIQCGTVHDENVAFCPKCGTKLGDDENQIEIKMYNTIYVNEEEEKQNQENEKEDLDE